LEKSAMQSNVSKREIERRDDSGLSIAMQHRNSPGGAHIVKHPGYFITIFSPGARPAGRRFDVQPYIAEQTTPRTEQQNSGQKERY